MFYNSDNGKRYNSVREVIQDFKDISFTEDVYKGLEYALKAFKDVNVYELRMIGPSEPINPLTHKIVWANFLKRTEVEAEGGNTCFYSLVGSSVELTNEEKDKALLLEQVKKSAYSDAVRKERNKLLLESDWTQIADSPLNQSQKDSWAQYRQQLRDITKQQEFPNVVWPNKP